MKVLQEIENAGDGPRRQPDAAMDEDTGRAILNQWGASENRVGALPGALGVAAVVLVDVAEAVAMGETSLLPADGSMDGVLLLSACERALSCIRGWMEAEAAAEDGQRKCELRRVHLPLQPAHQLER